MMIGWLGNYRTMPLLIEPRQALGMQTEPLVRDDPWADDEINLWQLYCVDAAADHGRIEAWHRRVAQRVMLDSRA